MKIVGETSTVLKTINTVLSNISVTSQSATVSNGILANSLSGYSIAAIKAAISQSTLNETQIRAILIEKGFEGQLLETTTAELAQTTATNALAASEKAATGSTIGLGNAVKGLGASLEALVAAHPILAAIAALGAIAFGTAKAYDALNVSAEEAKERTDELMSSYKEALETAESHKSTVKELAGRYQELSKHVNDLGETTGLTTEETEEYHDMCNQIAEMFPTLVQGYTDEGNAILTLKGNVEALTEAYEAETQAAYNALIASGKDINGNDIITDWKYSLSEDKGKGTNITKAIEELQAFMTSDMDAQLYTELREKAATGFYDGMTDAEKLIAGSEFIPFKLQLDLDKDGIITDEELAKAKSEAKTLFQTYNAEIESEFSNVKTLANAYLMTNEDYQELDGQAKSAASILINSIPATSDIAQVLMTGKKEEIGGYVDFIVRALSADSAVVEDALVNLLTLDTEKMSVDEIRSQADRYINVVADALHEDADALKVRLGVDYSDIDEMVEKVKSKLQDKFDDKAGGLTLEDLEIAANLNVPDGTFLSWEQLEKRIANVKNEIKNLEQPSFEDAISQVEALSEGLDQLDKIYADVYDKGDFDWSSILNNEDFSKTFSGFTEEYNSFIQTISNSPSDINACQESFNRLASAYLNASDVLGSQLTEETKKATIEILKQQGFVNAETLVTQVLTQRKEELALEEQFEAAAKQSETVESQNLTNATMEEINQLAAEGKIVPQIAEQMSLLAFKKQWVNKNAITTSGDIKNLAALATTSSKLTQLLNALAIAKQQVEGGIAPQAMAATIASLEKQIDDYVNGNFGNFQNPIYGGGSATKSAINKSSSKEKEATIETFNFIETLLSRLAKAFDKLKTAGENTFKTLATRAGAYDQALSVVTKQLETQQQAYNAYIEKANSIGLDEYWASQVRDGSLNILDVTDDGLKEKIKAYQEWYEKALDCKDALEDLNIEQTELLQAKIELYVKKYDDLLEKLSNRNDRIQNKIGLKEAWGFSGSKTNYTNMNKNLQKQINYTVKQNEELKKLLATVEKGSEAWYEYKQRIDTNTSSLQDMQKQMVENAKTAAELAGQTASSKVDKYNAKDELYDAKIDNALTAKKQNGFINKKISNINKKQDAYDDAVTKDKKNVKSAKKKLNNFKKTKDNKSVLKEIKKYTKAGKRIPKSLLNKTSKLDDNGKLYNACVQYNAYLDAYNTDKATAELFAETSKQTKADLALEKFNNISDVYDNKISKNEQKKTSINNQISLAEEQGKHLSTSYYKGLISAETAEQNKLIKKRDALQKSLDTAVDNGLVKKGSEEWYQMVNAINDVTNAIDESTLSLAEYNNQLRQLRWDAFDDALETIGRLNSEADFYINLISNEKLINDDGNFSEYGNATLALRNTNYENYLAQAEAYAKEYQELMETGDKTDKNVIKRLRELEDAEWNARLAAESEKQAIIDLVREGYEAQLEALSRLIQKYKDLKQNEKDAYEYQKSISEKTKNIAALQKQLAAYGENDTEEARAKIQKLKVELEEAQQDLQETEYDKYLSDMNDMLDGLYDDFEACIDGKLNQTNDILNKIKEMIGDGKDILKTLDGLGAGVADDGGVTDILENAVTSKTDAESYVNDTVAQEKAEIEKAPDTATATTPAEKKEPFEKTAISQFISNSNDTDMIKQNTTTLVKASGEDGIAFVKNGEGFLSPEQVKYIQELLDATPDITTYMKDMSSNARVPEFKTVNRQMGDVNVNFGDIILPDVTNGKELAANVKGIMKDAFCNDNSVRKCAAESLAPLYLGKQGIGKAKMYLH